MKNTLEIKVSNLIDGQKHKQQRFFQPGEELLMKGRQNGKVINGSHFQNCENYTHMRCV